MYENETHCLQLYFASLNEQVSNTFDDKQTLLLQNSQYHVVSTQTRGTSHLMCQEVLLLPQISIRPVSKWVPLQFLSSLVSSLPIIVGFSWQVWVCGHRTHSYTQLPCSTRTYCTFSIPCSQSPASLVLWTTFCLFIINALLISTSLQRAGWPFIQVSMRMTQIPDLFGAPWPGPALLDRGSPAFTRRSLAFRQVRTAERGPEPPNVP